jgi:hypothetical protein
MHAALQATGYYRYKSTVYGSAVICTGYYGHVRATGYWVPMYSLPR